MIAFIEIFTVVWYQTIKNNQLLLSFIIQKYSLFNFVILHNIHPVPSRIASSRGKHCEIKMREKLVLVLFCYCRKFCCKVSFSKVLKSPFFANIFISLSSLSRWRLFLGHPVQIENWEIRYWFISLISV